MRLPEELSARVAQLVAAVPAGELKEAAGRLSQNYRLEQQPGRLRTQAERLAYLAVRMPATYAAARSALASAAESLPDWAPKSLVDLGAGPGTALWAASELFPSLQILEGVEQDHAFLSLGRELALASPNLQVRGAAWSNLDLRQWRPDRRYDLVLACYSLGELAALDSDRLVLRAWEACDGTLVVIEPGTRRGFGTVSRVRDLLIGAGATLAAPCPHAKECPMLAARDWCHFSARIERTSQHRQLKEGELGHEDEKFSYVAASRIPAHPAIARIVRHPLRYSGHTRLTLCATEGLREETVTRSQKDRYRAAKHCEWGSRWDPT